MVSSPKYNKKLRNVLTLSFLVPLVFLMLSSGLFFYFIAKKTMENEMGRRLITIANIVSLQAKGWGFTTLSPGDEESRTFKIIVEKLKRLKASSGMRKIYIFDSDNKSLADSDESVQIGSEYYNHSLHSDELSQAKKGYPTTSILFKGQDGKFYKSGFAPITDQKNRVLGFVGVEASADFFAGLKKLKNNLIAFVIIGILITIMIGLIISGKIVSPIKKLVSAAKEIGEGKNADIRIKSKDEIGFLAHAISEMKDNITERDNRLRVMMHGIAHEVRNPLGGIELFAGLLREELKNSTEHLHYIEKIETEIKNLKNLVEEFLDFSKTVKPMKSVVSTQNFLEQLKFNFTNEFQEKHIDFATEISGASSLILDPDQMKRVLLNLLRNSLDATPAGGKISLTCSTYGNHWIISVEDSGSGISPEHIDKIFEPFFTTKERGSGLGLSFAKKIVNSHKGDINIDSTKGKGTRVTITIPKPPLQN